MKSEIKFSKLKQTNLGKKEKLTVSNKIKNTEIGRNCKKGMWQGKGFSERKKNYSEMCRELVPIGQFIYLLSLCLAS